MYVPFNELQEESRLWVYTASRRLTTAEIKQVERELQNFCEEWAAHGTPLKTSFQVLANQFIVLAVDENHHNPSGCSIDSSVRVLRSLEHALGVELLNRSTVAFERNQDVILVPLPELKQQFQQGLLHPATITFNTLVTTKNELEARWKLPAEKTWLVKYLPKITLTP